MKLHTRTYYRIATGALFFIQGLIYASWASRIPDIKHALNMSDAVLGGVLFALPVGQLSAMALSGYLVSKFGSKRIIRVALSIFALALVGIGLVSTTWQLSVVLFIFGVGANMTNISINTQGVGIERIYKRSILSAFHGAWSLAGFIGGIFGAFMANKHITPFNHYLAILAIALVTILTMYPMLLSRDHERHYSGKTSTDNKLNKVKFTRPDRYIILLGVIVFINFLCEGTMISWSSLYFVDVVKSDPRYIMLGYIGFMFTMALGRFLADGLRTHFGAITIIRASSLITFTGLMTSVLFPSLLSATIGFVLVGFGVSAVVPICYSLAGHSPIMASGLALTTVATIGFLGFLIGPPVVGFIAESLNLRWSFAIIAISGLLIVFIAPYIKRE